MVAEPEGGYSVFVPDPPSVATQGETIEETRANAQEAIEGYLALAMFVGRIGESSKRQLRAG